jgi:acetyl-CoA C-acetyltransferase
MPDYEPAVILSACRTPIGSFGGALKDFSSVDLGAIVIREAIRRAEVKAMDLGDVIMGCVLQAGAGMNVARQAAIKAGVPRKCPARPSSRAALVCSRWYAVEATRVGYTDLVLPAAPSR